MESKDIIISILAIVSLASSSYTVNDLVTEQNVLLYTHYCEDRDLAYNCDDFSKYYGLGNGKCMNYEKGNKLCRSGWKKITPEESINYVYKYSIAGGVLKQEVDNNNFLTNICYFEGRKHFCSEFD